MRLISFDALRTLKFPEHRYLKPELFLNHLDEIREADFVLFPEYWQLNPLVYGCAVRTFPSEATYRIGHNKIEMTRVLSTLFPANLPQTWILPNTPTSSNKILDTLDYPFVAKLVKSARGEGVFLIQNRLDWQHYVAQADVLYVQEYLQIDRDLRLVVIGEHVVGGYWRLQSMNGFHNNISQGGMFLSADIPQAAIDLVTQVATTLGIDHAGFDVAMVGNHPYLFEFNRIFGNQGIQALIGDLTEPIIAFLHKTLADDQQDDPFRPNRSGGPGGGRRMRKVA
ncbi:RimK family alpha-L-glutamate ligase [Reinekea sp. G2M2-21]|uniref:ATP-grasp domain-containing protein n=1 Tax=Reinekea sp. G2M2-21 TaxID=2788942 RepID=UPI0018AB0860|nr:hypothetical protein [Reinekea sp. G2M2-21]